MRLHRFLVPAMALAALVTSCKEEEDPAVFDSEYAVGDFYEFGCDTIGSIQSQLGTPSTYIYFNNESSRTLKVIWVNFTGGMTPYDEDLKPGEGFLQQTYLGHPWKVTDANDECLTVLMAAEEGVTDTVTFVD
jgi:hypothetical protein